MSLVLYPHFFPSLCPPSQCLLLFPSTAHPGHLQAAQLCLPNLPPVQLWEWVDAASQDKHRGPDPQRLWHWCLSEPILPKCPGLDVHFLLHPGLGLLHLAPPAQQVCHTQNKVRKTEVRHSVVYVVYPALELHYLSTYRVWNWDKFQWIFSRF